MTVQIYLLLGLAWLGTTFLRLSANKNFREKFNQQYQKLKTQHGKGSAVTGVVIGITLASVIRTLAWPVYLILYILNGGKSV